MRSTCGCPAAFGGSVAPRGMSGISRGSYPWRYSGVSKAGPAFASMAGIRRPSPVSVPSGGYGAAPATTTTPPTTVVWASGKSPSGSSNKPKGGASNGGGGLGFDEFAAGATSIIDSIGNLFSGRGKGAMEQQQYAPAPTQGVPDWVWYAGGALAVGGLIMYARG